MSFTINVDVMAVIALAIAVVISTIVKVWADLFED